MRKSWISYLGIAIGLFGIALLVADALFGDNCWGTYQVEKYASKSNNNDNCHPIANLRNCLAGSAGTIAEPIYCNFWFSYLFIGLTSLFGGSILYVFGLFRNPSPKIYKR